MEAERKLPKLLELNEVESATKYNKSSIYLGVKKGEFPAPIKLGGNKVAWLEDDIIHWLQTKIAESKGH